MVWYTGNDGNINRGGDTETAGQMELLKTQDKVLQITKM